MNTINATEGMWLTQANPETEVIDRVFVRSVSGYGDLESLYRTATEEEKQQTEALQKQLSEEADALDEQQLGL